MTFYLHFRSHITLASYCNTLLCRIFFYLLLSSQASSQSSYQILPYSIRNMPTRSRRNRTKTPAKRKNTATHLDDRNIFTKSPITRLKAKYANYANLRLQREASVATWHDSKYIHKFLFCCLFFAISTYLNSLAAVVAGFRTPQQSPLPDIAHEYLPVEWLGSMLGANNVRTLPDHIVKVHLVVSITVVVLHSQRWNIVKRFLCIFGFINLLRAVTVTVTLLPDMSPRRFSKHILLFTSLFVFHSDDCSFSLFLSLSHFLMCTNK